MKNTSIAAATALEKLSESLFQAIGQDEDLASTYGWFAPALNRSEITSQINFLAKSIKERSNNLDETASIIISEIPKKVEIIISTNIPYINNGNAGQALPAIFEFVNWVFFSISPIIGWESVRSPEAMPKSLARRISALDSRITSLEPEQKTLENKLKLINDATIAADELPESLETLNAAKIKANSASEQAERAAIRSEENEKKINSLWEDLRKSKEEAKQVLNQCEQALRASTSVGLAAAFDARANTLSKSIRWWVFALAISLMIGAFLVFHRMTFLADILNSNEPKWGVLFMHLFLSALSIGAPLWFSWMATKQISHRFKLSEDYAFKASVAKAYEGYRSEASKIDKAFVSRLFGSALDRLDEAPMRVMENFSPGSPAHEFFDSQVFKNALEKIPNLRDEFSKYFRASLKKNNENSQNDSVDPAKAKILDSGSH